MFCIARLIPSVFCTGWLGSSWNVDTCLFFLLIDSCFLHNFSKECRFLFEKEVLSKHQSMRVKDGGRGGYSTPALGMIHSISWYKTTQTNRQTMKTKQNKTTTPPPKKKWQRTSRHNPFSVCLFCHLAVLMFQHVASWIVAILPELAGFRHHWLQNMRQNEFEVWQWVYIKFRSWQYCLSWLGFLHFWKLYLSFCAWALFSSLAGLHSV